MLCTGTWNAMVVFLIQNTCISFKYYSFIKNKGRYVKFKGEFHPDIELVVIESENESAPLEISTE